MNVDSTDNLHFAWYHQVIPLLQEYFYNDGERLRAVIGEDFIKPVKMTEANKRALGEYYDPDLTRYTINYLENDSFLEALQKLASE